LEWAADADRDEDCDEKTTALESHDDKAGSDAEEHDFDFSKLPSGADQMV
jgi:hypothetical protein